MKRDERNLISRTKIIDSALKEFAQQGYGLSSVNTICSQGDISKGILYHYFKDKDELYLACVRELFEDLTRSLSAELGEKDDEMEMQLEQYFDARLRFFNEKPLYHKLFCDVVITPPKQLAQEISEIKKDFDALNISVLTKMLQGVKLRQGLTVAAAVETFRRYQDFVNARRQMDSACQIDVEQHEQTCRRTLNILLYGVVERGESDYEQ